MAQRSIGITDYDVLTGIVIMCIALLSTLIWVIQSHIKFPHQCGLLPAYRVMVPSAGLFFSLVPFSLVAFTWWKMNAGVWLYSRGLSTAISSWWGRIVFRQSLHVSHDPLLTRQRFRPLRIGLRSAQIKQVWFCCILAELDCERLVVQHICNDGLSPSPSGSWEG